jgi:hypothetical protein
MAMPTTDKIAQYDVVELMEPADGAEAGERGVALDIFDDRAAMVELRTLPPAELDLDRIIIAPLDKLHLVDSPPR